MTQRSWKIRITDDNLSPEVINNLAQRYGLTLLVREVGSETERPHYHGILSTTKTRGAIVTFINKHYRGNEQYSLGVCPEPQGYLNYMCKGEDGNPPNVVYNQGHDTDRYHAQYLAHKENVQEEKRERRETQGNITQQIYDDIKEKIGHSTYESVIGGAICRWYLDRRKVMPTRYRMQALINTFIAWQNEDANDADQLTDEQLYDQLYRQV